MGGAGALDFWLRGRRGLETHTSESEGGCNRSSRAVLLGLRENRAQAKLLSQTGKGQGPGLLGLRELGAGVPRMTDTDKD